MIEITQILEVKNHIEEIEAVIFDLDDTLYSEKEYVRSGYRKIAAALPQIKNVESRLWKWFEEGKPAIDELMKEEQSISEKEKQSCIQLYRQQIPEIHLYDGVQEMLELFRSKGIKLGIITDGRPEGQRAKIKVLKLEKLVDFIIVTDELGGIEFRKPHPRALQRMKETLGTEYPKMCYVGDNIRKDFVSPENLGMRSIWFRNSDGIYTTKGNSNEDNDFSE